MENDIKVKLGKDTDEKESVHKTEKKGGLKKKWILVIISLLVLVLLTVAVSYWMIYHQPGQNAYEEWLINTFPIPVATVNGKIVKMSDYQKTLDGMVTFFNKQDEQQLNLVERPSDEDLRNQELDRLIEVELLEQIATENDISVTQKELDEYFTNEILPQSAGGLEEAKQTFLDLYNWSVDDFKKYVLYEVILIQKIEEEYAQDEEEDQVIKQKAEDLYNEIVNTEKPFSEYAEEYSDDTGSAANGGMLGFFGEGVMVSEFEEAAFALNIGEVSQPVKTQYGYHLIKVTDKDEEAGTVEARHILFSFKTIRDRVDELKNSSTILKLLPKYE